MEMTHFKRDPRRSPPPVEQVPAAIETYVDQAADGIYVLDRESGRILKANDRAVQMLGFSREELLRLSAGDIEVTHPAAAIRSHHERALQGVVQVEGMHRRKDGSTFPVEIRISSLAPGRPDLLLALVRDTTDRTRAEAALRDESRLKDEFLALLGHELRNPLAAISTALQVLAGAGTPSQRAEMQDVIGRQVALMRRLLDDLLDLARITHGQMELQKGPIDLTDFLRNAAAPFQSTFASRRQEFVLRPPSETVQFVADEARLEQIVANLLSNASKYTGDGGRIELSGAREGCSVVIHCQDNGQGVLPENRETIFERFTRGRESHYSHGEASLGIGLALAKQLTVLHGGTIAVESGGAGMGSEFAVRLPLVEPRPVQAVAPTSGSTLASQPARTIVIVEDNPSVAKAMQLSLEQAGHDVHLFADGPAALAGIAGLAPDAVVLDIGLPAMDGYELASELRKLANLRDALFIALSGFVRREPSAKPGDHFDHYLVKPAGTAEILALLAKLPPAANTAAPARARRRAEPARYACCWSKTIPRWPRRRRKYCATKSSRSGPPFRARKRWTRRRTSSLS